MTEPVLGRPDATPGDQIDTFRVEGPLDLVHFHSSELTAVCPVTDQPDFYTIDIEYVPGSRCIETKSIKLYLRTFDNRGIFAEHLANAVGVPVTVGLAQQVHGGIVTTVTATGTPT
ncbi:MAG TPA: 7-cyano-7-deazaguanine reductase [Acidimicrobiia bacterium]|jgi:7-cyano-7-deazaguanine reductase|nr:7-cyano-7-deazaguanine reductase [Acidimicrobiia bacterium]